MLRRSRIALAATALSIATVALAAHAASLGNLGKGRIKIEAEAKPALGKFDGSASEITAKEEGGKIIFSAKLYEQRKDPKTEKVEDVFHIDMGLRQDHTVEAFEVKKHPNVKLVVDKSKINLPADKQTTEGKVDGELTLHGQTKPVKIEYKLKRAGSDLIVNGTKFTFNYKDFGVEKISRMGISVSDPVTITVTDLKLREK